MSFRKEIRENQTVIYIDNLLIPDQPSFSEFEQLTQQIPASDGGEVTLDLKGCPYVDTRAASSLILLSRNLNKQGRTFRIINANKDILELFQSTKLDQIIKISGI